MTEAKVKKETKPKAVKAPKVVKEKVAKVAKPKVERIRQNGQTRPQPGSKTGLVWDIADAISAKLKRPALRNEVFDELEKQAKEPSYAMAGTQYSRWCAFYGVAKELSKFKSEQRKERDAAAKKEKADKKAASEQARKDKEAAKVAKETKKAA